GAYKCVGRDQIDGSFVPRTVQIRAAELRSQQGGYAPPQLEMHRSFVLRFQLARRIDQYGSLGKGRGVARLRSHSGCRVVIGLFRGDGNRITGREGFLQPFIQGLLFLLWGLLAPWVRRSSSAR